MCWKAQRVCRLSIPTPEPDKNRHAREVKEINVYGLRSTNSNPLVKPFGENTIVGVQYFPSKPWCLEDTKG